MEVVTIPFGIHSQAESPRREGARARGRDGATQHVTPWRDVPKMDTLAHAAKNGTIDCRKAQGWLHAFCTSVGGNVFACAR